MVKNRQTVNAKQEAPTTAADENEQLQRAIALSLKESPAAAPASALPSHAPAPRQAVAAPTGDLLDLFSPVPQQQNHNQGAAVISATALTLPELASASVLYACILLLIRTERYFRDRARIYTSISICLSLYLSICICICIYMYVLSREAKFKQDVKSRSKHSGEIHTYTHT